MTRPIRKKTVNLPSNRPLSKTTQTVRKTRRLQIDRRSRLLPLLQQTNAPTDLNGPQVSTELESTTTVRNDGSFDTTPTKKKSAPARFTNSEYYATRIFAVGESSSQPENLIRRKGRQQKANRPKDEILDLGLPTLLCIYCGAYFWPEEALHRPNRKANPMYSLCCQHGQVALTPLQQTPPMLERLLDIDGDALSKHYRTHIRSYNAAFSWTSFGAKLSSYVQNSRGPYSLVLCGENYHFMGSLLPVAGERPRYSQLYVFDPTTEIADRYTSVYGHSHGLNEELLHHLKIMLDEYNVLAQSFRRVREAIHEPANHGLRLRITGKRVENDRQYELPTGTELAGLIPGDFEPGKDDRDIIVNHCSTGLTRITSLNPLYDSLHFPLLFPHGNDGFHEQIRYNEEHIKPGKKRECVTQREYYAYRLQYRQNEGKTLIRSGKALQHFCIDAFTTIEQNRLMYLRMHQQQLRSDNFKNISAAVARGDNDSTNLGRIINPSSFTGSVRYMRQLYFDAIAVCQHHGNPDLFITFTCNAQWPEIINAFQNDVGPNSEDKPAIVARVFKMKLTQLRADLKKAKYLGKSIAGMHTVEFQKRGLPHAHIIIWLAPAHKASSAHKIDNIISAELPDPSLDPRGYDVVTKFMLHGPCGIQNPLCKCMKDGICSKFFPKTFNTETTVDGNGYVNYRRRQSGLIVSKPNGDLDNRHVVPYNRYLLIKYQAHINVEICHKGQLIKYLFKYILKGPDRSRLCPERTDGSSLTSTNDPAPQIDEIQNYIDCRSISSYEAVWRLLEFKIHERTPTVFRMTIHLPDEQTIAWDESQSIDSILHRPDIEKTMLTEWFELNRRYPSARKYIYSEVPNAFIWNKKISQWVPRKRGFSIGRIANVLPNAGEIFYFRLLLTKLRGPLSFLGMRTVNGVVHEKYQTACEALGFLSTDDEWSAVMAEVSQWGMPAVIRSTFISLLLFCEVASPSKLFEKWWFTMSDDFKRTVRNMTANPAPQAPPEMLRNQVLLILQNLLSSYSTTLAHYNLPSPTLTNSFEEENNLVSEQLQYDQEVEKQSYEASRRALNSCQKSAHDAILSSFNDQGKNLFFLYGYGGTGKTYLYNCIISKVRSEGKIAIVVASSGIAATLLPGGVTAHSRFKIPIDVDHTSTCMINKGSSLAQLMELATLIVWDEAPMVHKLSFEAVDRTLCDIMNVPSSGPSYIPFGGKTVLLGGDFRQTLPVVPNGSREDNLNASLTRSYLWKYCTLLHLVANMRIINDVVNRRPICNGLCFPNWVLAIGDGKLQTVAVKKSTITDWIQIPQSLLIIDPKDPIQELVMKIYPHLTEQYQQVGYLRARAILAPTNRVVNAINNYILQQLPGQEKTYYSADTLSTAGSNQVALQEEYPTEFLNQLSFNGVPDHELCLKKYSIVMILRNLNPSAGLCNGTRLLITNLGDNTLRGLIIGGSYEGTIAVIPRIIFDKNDPNWPFTLKRRQFPVRLCYAMTINKSQGQTLENVGLFLPTPVFSHGQLYVALSRVRSIEGIHVVVTNEITIPENVTRNIVYTEVFDDLHIDSGGV